MGSAILVALLPAAIVSITSAAAVGGVTTQQSMVGALKDSSSSLKFGDPCNNTRQCDYTGAVCDPTLKKCQCLPTVPITNHIDKCGKKATVNETCTFNEQCESTYYLLECREEKCACRFENIAVVSADGAIECTAAPKPTESPHHVDPAMIGILAGMALMFIIICVVLRLFSKARWRENRTIFNTPNPRLMNVSLLQHNKGLHDGRRGSKGSVRGPSRTGSVSSLRPHSPSASQGSRNGSKCNSRRGSNNPSPTPKSPTKPEENNISVLESVTVESEPLNEKA